MKAGRWLTLAALALFAVASGAAVAQDVPLGDLARKNRKEPSKTKKVITNEDIPESPNTPSSSPSSGGASSAANSAAGESGQSASAAPGGEAKPAGAGGTQAAGEEDDEITQAQEEVEGLKKTEGTATKNIERMEELVNAEGISEFRRNMYLDAINRARADVSTLQQQRAEKEKALAEAKERKKKEAEAKGPAPAGAPAAPPQ